MSRLPHFLDNQLTDGGEVVSLTRWPLFTPRKIPGTRLLELSRPQGHSAAGRIKLIDKSKNLIANRTHDFLACSTVPQPTMLMGGISQFLAKCQDNTTTFFTPLPHS
jgi:hypothetical protein